MTTALEILEEAFDKLGPNGEHWIQGIIIKEVEGAEPSYCMMGALEWSKGTTSEKEAAISVLYQVLGQGRPVTITAFNDNEETTWKDVERVFKQAIEEARKESTE